MQLLEISTVAELRGIADEALISHFVVVFYNMDFHFTAIFHLRNM